MRCFFHSEKRGGNKKSNSLIDGFRGALEACDLFDRGFNGYPFTWANNHENGLIEERIDRVCANPAGKSLFPRARVNHVSASSSDHCPLVFDCLGQPPVQRRWVKKQFRFEAMWTRDSGCEEVIKQQWFLGLESEASDRVSNYIVACGKALMEWNKVFFGKVQVEINKLRKEIKALDLHKDRPGNRSLLKIANDRLDELLAREEIMWRQGSRICWLQDDDQNTSFFHNSTTARQVRNNIHGIFYANENWISDQGDMLKVVREYFVDIFHFVCSANSSSVLDAVERRVTDEMNMRFLRKFENSEIFEALNQMHPTKAPGPDGLPTLFFQKYWKTVGSDVTDAVLNVLNGGKIDKRWNPTQIILIPKVKDPKYITDYRPIALWNMIYKLNSKVVVNRLKEILPEVISKEQSAFLPERLITDNVISGGSRNPAKVGHKFFSDESSGLGG